MNTYEFWNDMDKIFEAIVAYQEKTIEFNKRFINPWVNLGNVFDKEETIEAIAAHKNAIEINPENAQNWYELASTYTRLGDFDNSIQAYQKAIELGFESVELYKNLALAYAMTARYQESILVFQKALGLSESNKDKAVVWNHLGNVYRKLNNYELALQAFQDADQLESAMTTMSEELPTKEADKEVAEVAIAQADAPSAFKITDEPATIIDNVPAPEENDLDEANNTTFDSDNFVVEQTEDYHEEEPKSASTMPPYNEIVLPVAEEYKTEEEDDDIDFDMPIILEVDFSTDSPVSLWEETITEEIDEESAEKEPTTDYMTTSEEKGVPSSSEAAEEETEPDEQDMTEFPSTAPAVVEQTAQPWNITAFMNENDWDDQEVDLEEGPVSKIIQESIDFVGNEIGAEDDDFNDGDYVDMDDENADEDVDTGLNPAMVPLAEEQFDDEVSGKGLVASENDKEIESPQESDATNVHLAYEEYLEHNSNSPNVNLTESRSKENQTTAMGHVEVEVTNLEINTDVNPDLTVDIDTKNAHVWNELGNVYFKAGSFEDAIAAYSKAIELDRQFPWPYTNLALSYVQKGSLAEATLLYQRSIELFSNEKDKAVSWNRLGNVYRRLNDYENAIAAYQRADELDPGNTAITPQSRYSILGSEKVNQEVGYSL